MGGILPATRKNKPLRGCEPPQTGRKYLSEVLDEKGQRGKKKWTRRIEHVTHIYEQPQGMRVDNGSTRATKKN